MRAGVRVSIAVAVASGGFVVPSMGSAKQDGRVFYLSLHPRQCVIAPAVPSKTLFVVPCSNSAHNLEVYAVKHGGWGRKAPTPRSAGLVARSVCLASYRRLTGHGTPRTAGWEFFVADPGTETARYGDTIVCTFRAWPRLVPLGKGWHVR